MAKLTQEQLGVLAGIDEASASARMNQYERGRHVPDFSMMVKIGEVLGVPTPYFYAEDSELATLLLRFGKLPRRHRSKVFELLDELLIVTNRRNGANPLSA